MVDVDGSQFCRVGDHPVLIHQIIYYYFAIAEIHQMNRVNSRQGFDHDESTINIVGVIIIIIIIIIIF